MRFNFNPHNMGFNAKSLRVPRQVRVKNNIDSWKSVLETKYTSKSFESIMSYLADDYCWYGSYGVSCSVSDSSFFDVWLKKSGLFNKAFSNLSVTHFMFGEGPMVGNYTIYQAVHDGDYSGIKATGNKVCFYGVSLARFDEKGRLVEERELWDELSLLKQIGVVDKDLAPMDGLFLSASGRPIAPKYFPKLMPDVTDILFNNDQCGLTHIDAQVKKNIANWREFTVRKYLPQDDSYYSNLAEVMADNYKIRGLGGFEMDNTVPEEVASVLRSFKAFTESFPDVKFTSKLFGEGDMVLYHVAYEFTHSSAFLGVPATGKKLCGVNISIGRFDSQGRILEECEIHDLLSQYKQLGVIEDSYGNDSILQAMRSVA